MGNLLRKCLIAAAFLGLASGALSDGINTGVVVGADGIANPTGGGGGGGCTQATNYIALLDGSQNNTAITTLICGLVTDGTFSLFDVLYIFAINSSANALINAANPSSFAGTAHGAPAFSASNGFTGVDGSSTVYIDTGFNPTVGTPAYQQNSGHLSIWSFTNLAGQAAIGNTSGSNNSRIYPKYSGDNSGRFDVNSNTSTALGVSDSRGYFFVSRNDSGHTKYYRNGSSIGNDTQASVAVTSLNCSFFVLGQQTNCGGLGGTGGGYQLGIASIGGAVSDAQALSIYNRLCTYMTTVHGSC